VGCGGTDSAVDAGVADEDRDGADAGDADEGG
jgi:hypothetical protein